MSWRLGTRTSPWRLFIRREVSESSAGGTANAQYGGFVAPHVHDHHKRWATVFGTTLWLWVFWRAKHDWRQVLLGEHPFEHPGQHSIYDLDNYEED